MTGNIKVVKSLAGLLVLATLAGCSKYSTYKECRLVEEKGGASTSTAVTYCYDLVEKGEISMH